MLADIQWVICVVGYDWQRGEIMVAHHANWIVSPQSTLKNHLWHRKLAKLLEMLVQHFSLGLIPVLYWSVSLKTVLNLDFFVAVFSYCSPCFSVANVPSVCRCRHGRWLLYAANKHSSQIQTLVSHCHGHSTALDNALYRCCKISLLFSVSSCVLWCNMPCYGTIYDWYDVRIVWCLMYDMIYDTVYNMIWIWYNMQIFSMHSETDSIKTKKLISRRHFETMKWNKMKEKIRSSVNYNMT